jgi:hypothetical protein
VKWTGLVVVWMSGERFEGDMTFWSETQILGVAGTGYMASMVLTEIM